MDITQLINHPELLNRETLYDLRSLVALYPYYQLPRLLMLQNLYILHDPAFDAELRKAAIYMTDRRVLFDMVEAAHYRIEPEEKSTEKDAGDGDASENRTLSLIDNYLSTLHHDGNGENVPKRKPTLADAAVDYVAYMLATEGEEERGGGVDTPVMKGQELIDDFIKNDNGRIQLTDDPEYIPQIADESPSRQDDTYFTETLAKIYIDQKKYSKAVEIIKRINLNYPKKNVYFADQIRFLEKLILNNKSNK